MDSPETEKTAPKPTSAPIISSGSPPVQDSPIFSYISNLSPIKPVKTSHVAHGLLELSSPPLVFTSPRINSLRESSSLKRSQLPRPLSAECKKVAAGSDVSTYTTIQSNSKLVKYSDTNGPLQPCSSSGCVDGYLADPAEVDSRSVSSVYLYSSSLKQSHDLLQSSQCGCTDINIEVKKEAGNRLNADLASSQQAHEEPQGRSMSDVKPPNTRKSKYDVGKPSAELVETKFNASSRYANKQAHCEQSIVQVHNGCSSISKSYSNRPFGNKLQQDLEACQHHGTLRRCLQFGDSQTSAVPNRTSSQSPTNIKPMTSSHGSPVDVESLDSIRADLTASCSDRQLVNSPQPVTANLLSSQHRAKPGFSVSKPSHIGLHLNSFVKSLPMGGSASASMRSDDKKISGVKRTRTDSHMNLPLVDSNKGGKVPLNVLEKSSASIEDGRYETNYSNALPAASQCLQIVKSLSSPLDQTKHVESPHDKMKTNSDYADNFEELNQMSPLEKKKKLSSPNSGDGCKRCNCKKSKCLKLYCDCFAAGIYCAEPCACQGCFNRPEYEDTVLETRQQIELRNPLAFTSKIQLVTSTPSNIGEDANWLTSSARHKRGCNCKKSMCQKKYCECYQANVGCSDGCRCLGCKNVFGKKEEYGLTNIIVGGRESNERVPDTSKEKLDVVASQKDTLDPNLSYHQSLAPSTPLFQSSNHRKDETEYIIPLARYLRSPESAVSILSSCEKSARLSRGSDTHDMFPVTREGMIDIVCDEELNLGNAEVIDQFNQRCGLANISHPVPPQNALSIPKACSASTKTREKTNASQTQLCPQTGGPSSSGSLRWRYSPVTPMPVSDMPKMKQGVESDDSMLHDILGDDTLDILNDVSTSKQAVKVSSPNKKRVSPPHHHLHALGSNTSAGLRSGRKFILQAIPSFPPLTPCTESKSIGHENTNNQEADLSS